jgi:hypothetical protein
MIGINADNLPLSIRVKYRGLYLYDSCKTLAQADVWKKVVLSLVRSSWSHLGYSIGLIIWIFNGMDSILDYLF